MDVIAQLLRQEPLFHRGQDPDLVAAPDFWEVGASGRVYEREFVVATVRDRGDTDGADEWEIEEVACRELGPDTFLFTYLLHQGERRTRRATVWRRGPNGWQALYHQGTLAG